MKSKNTIEINGRLYDAKTGLPLTPKKTATKAVPTASARKFVDGFRPQKSTTSPKTTAKPKATAKTTSKVTRSATPKISLKTKRSTTLNRNAVKKPAKHTTATEKKAPATTSEKSALNSQRLKRASEVTKSNAISRFYRNAGDVVKAEAVKEIVASKTEALNEAREHAKQELVHKAIAAASVGEKMVNTAQHKVHKARSHHHFRRYLTSTLVVLLVAAYVTYLNVPSISMKVAAHRAGFAATMPEYRPSGYSLNGPISYSSGQVTVNFKSNTDNRRFSLEQQPTTWDSTALVENYVTKKTAYYIPVQDSGLTIYIFNGSSAAWVNNGKLYKIDGKNSELDADQMLKLATSV